MFSLMISMHIFYAPRSMNRKQNNFKSEKYSYIDYIKSKNKVKFYL